MKHTLALLTGLLLLSTSAFSAVVTFENPTLISIHDNSFENTNIVVSSVTGIVTKVTFEFSVLAAPSTFHNYDFRIRAPYSQDVLAISDVGVPFGFAGGPVFTVDDDFPSFPMTISPLLAHNIGGVTDYDPSFGFDSDPFILGGPGDLSKFNGNDPNGSWLITIVDDTDNFGDPILRIEDFKLHFTVIPEPSPIPEPSSGLLGVVGLCGVLLRRRRRSAPL